MHVCMYVYNIFTPQIKGFAYTYYICGVAGVLQLPNCTSATTSQWSVVQLPIGKQLIVKPTM